MFDMLPIIYRGHEQSGIFAQSLGYRPSEQLLLRLKDNQPGEGQRYACIIPVLDLWRMNLALAARNNLWHYTTGIEKNVLDDVRSRRAVLVFDLSNEGPPYNEQVFSDLYSWIENENIPWGHVVWLDQNRAMGLSAKRHAGVRAEMVRFEHYDSFVKYISFLFARPDESAVGHQHEELAGDLLDSTKKDKLLLCMNSTPRWHRVVTLAGLVYHDLVSDSLVSFPGPSYRENKAAIEAVDDFMRTAPSLDYLQGPLEIVKQFGALRVDSFAGSGTQLVGKIDLDPYRRTYFSLVTETEFTDGSCDRVTEKVVKAFCVGHPTLIVGNPNAVRFMTELGFADWGDVIDRSYESIIDPATRFDAIFQEIARMVASIRLDGDFWLGRVRDVSAHNIRHAVSGKLMENYVRLYDVPVVARLKAQIGL